MIDTDKVTKISMHDLIYCVFNLFVADYTRGLRRLRHFSFDMLKIRPDVNKFVAFIMEPLINLKFKIYH